LHVGCGIRRPGQLAGPFENADWTEVRLDIDSAVNPDIVGDIRDMAGVSDDSYDAVWSSHNIEHLYAHEVPLAMREFYRVLKPGGYLLLTCPDLQSVCALIAAGKIDSPAYTVQSGPIMPTDIIYGFGKALERGDVFMQHKTGFTRKTMVALISDAGFERAECVAGAKFDLWASGRRPAAAGAA
jgi:ubiquinone/menaquinone biosynthesis C-methylase UbiE